MSEDVKVRLQESAAACLTAYDSWVSNKKDSSARESLQTSVHELRKVASRLEIDMAVSDRDEGSRKQIPIPAHRDARKRKSNKDNNGNNDAPESANDEDKPSKPRQRRRTSNGPKKDGGSEE
ncbi:MAG: hypothetical protein CMH26_04395 [Micavibrio sp.]|nr:hypothetical protein [Micavibrio sp.]|tara:strand:+ start:1293 stop:1658 length:366 start_codon:yes stop_codon:yes gene_type:complete